MLNPSQRCILGVREFPRQKRKTPKMNRENEIEKRYEARVREELTPFDAEKAFDDMLDDCYSFDKVGGPFAYMSPSSVLKEVDPTAYRCGTNDYVDGLIGETLTDEIGGEHYDYDEAQTIRDEVETEVDAEIEAEEIAAEDRDNEEKELTEGAK